MKGVAGLNLQMAPVSGNIYLKVNKNVTVSCFPRLYNVTLMSVFSSDKSMQEGTSAVQHSVGTWRAAPLPRHVAASRCSSSPIRLPLGMAPKALAASSL